MHILSRHISPLRTLAAMMAMLLLLPLLQGCGGGGRMHADLLHAESIMEEHPDSAYTILSALHPDSAASDEDCALHALLLTQAMHKTDRLHSKALTRWNEADSMTRLAVEYFNTHDRKGRLMKALYYRGVTIIHDKDSFTNALLPLYESLELAKEADSTLWIAKNYESIGDVCFYADAYRDQMEMQRKALHYFRKTGREEYIKSATHGLGHTCINAGEYDRGIELAEGLLPHLEAEADSAYIAGCYQIFGKGYSFTKRDSLCITKIEEGDSLGYHDPGMDLYHIMAYLSIGDRKKAMSLYDRYYPELDDYDKAALHYAFEESSQARLTALQELFKTTATGRDNVSRLDLNSVHEKAMRNAGIRHSIRQQSAALKYGVAMASLLLTVGILIWMFYRRRRESTVKEEQNQILSLQNQNLVSINQELISANATVSQEKETALNEIHRMETAMQELRLQRDDTLRKTGVRFSRLLTNIIAENGRGSQNPTTTLERMRKEFDRYKPGTKPFKEWEMMLNMQHDNILEKICHDIPDLNREEKTISLYLLMGFSISTIGYMCGLEKRQMEYAISKLRKKIQALPEVMRIRYILLLPSGPKD